jgi:hypothetical protein
MAGNRAPHFHIRWIIEDISRTDWEAFTSRDEAELIARRLATPSETFAIDEFDDSCERCAMYRLERRNSN